MSQKIHPTAIIEDGAEIGKNVSIGAYCVIGSDVTIGDGCDLRSHVVVAGLTAIGEDCTIFPFASLGQPPQDLKFSGEKTTLKIGKNNIIREHVTMNPGTATGANETLIGDNCLFMVGAHVAHDCVIGNNVIVANNGTLAGHVEVGDFAILGGLSAVHQFIRIGAFAIIGGCTGVDSDVIPYGRVKGERGYLAGLNLIGLERQGLPKETIRNMQKAVKLLFGDDGTLEQRIGMLENEYGDDKLIRNIVDFAKAKMRHPLCHPQKK